MFTENKIRCFLTVAEQHSFTNAAKLLYMSQQAVSKSIAALEGDVGFRLFHRAGSTELTEQGKACYALMKRLYIEYNTGIEEIRSSHSAKFNSVAIGTQIYLDFGPVLNNAIFRIQRDFPGVTVDVWRYDPNVLFFDLMNRELDVIIINRRFLLHAKELKALELARTPMGIMYSDKLHLDEQAPFESLITMPFIVDKLCNESPEAFRQRIEREIAQWGLHPEAVITMPDRDSAYTAAELGDGVMIGTSMSRMAQGRFLKQYLLDKTEPLLAVWRADEENPLAARIAAHIQREFKEQKRQRAEEAL